MNLNELAENALAVWPAAVSQFKPMTVHLTPPEMAATIDHTLLRPDATLEQFQQLCHEARTHGFASVCVHPGRVALCVELLRGATSKVCTVVGFPQGATLSTVKAFEAEQAMGLGVAEVDMVMNVGRLKERDYAFVHADVAAVVEVVHAAGGLLKVIIETGLLSRDEKIIACALCKDAGADFVKTSTGFNGGGATVEDITLMRCTVGPEMGVKASGGVRSAGDALALLGAGASRIGASSGVRIVQELAGQVAATASGIHY